MKLPNDLALLNPETVYLPLKHGRATALAFGEGPTVLCLHGFPDNCLTYRYQVKPLVQAGFHVVLPVMRGYEPSSVQPDGRYYMADMADDVVRWIDRLGQGQVHLVGHDWGAVAAWATVGLAPERLKTVTTIAIPYLKRATQGLKAHPQQLLYSWYMNFFQLRGISDWGVSASDWWFIKFLWQRWSPDWQAPDEIMESVIDTLSQTGVKKAALSYYRCLYDAFSPPGRLTQSLFQKTVPMPAMLITGENDGCMHTDLYDTIIEPKDFVQGVAVHRLPNAGHFAQLEKPDEVNDLLLGFLKNHS
ncbi:MAG: alpha/beta hydrolase [Pseudomonadales bacterium]|nr:alpha/beta hydrolase [Pseudomonadales bacterium]